MKIIDEFKEFAIRGNAVELAVGIVIGASFNAIVNSFVDDLLMPPIGLLLGDVDFSSREIILREASEGVEAVTLTYGTFFNTIVEFLIIAVAVFILIKYINSLKRDEAEIKKDSPARTCPYCQLEIASEATRCPHCTTDLSN